MKELNTQSLKAENQLKVLDQITFLTTRLTSTFFFKILIPRDGFYFSHSRPEIRRSKIEYFRRNNQKCVKYKVC